MSERITTLHASNLLRLEQIEELKRRNLQLQEEIKRLQSVEEERLKMQEEIKKLHSIEEERVKLEKEVKNLLKLDEEIKSLASAKEEKLQMEQQIKKLQAKVENEKTEMEKQIQKLQDDLSSYQETTELIATEKTELEMEHKECDNKISEMRAIIQIQKDEIKMKEDQNANLLQEQHKMQQQMKELEEKATSIDTSFFDAVTREGNLQIELQDAREGIQTLRNTMLEISEKQEEEQKRMKHLLQDKHRMQQQINTLEERNASLETRLSDSITIEAAQQLELRDARENIQTLRANLLQVSNDQEERHKRMNDLLQDQQKMQQRMKALEERGTSVDTRLFDSITREGTLQIEVQAAQETIQILRQNVQNQRVQIEQLQISAESARALDERLSESEMQQGILQSKIQCITDENQGLKEIMKNQQQKIEQLEKERDDLQDVLDSNVAHNVSQDMAKKQITEQATPVRRTLRPRNVKQNAADLKEKATDQETHVFTIERGVKKNARKRVKKQDPGFQYTDKQKRPRVTRGKRKNPSPMNRIQRCRMEAS